MLYCSLRYDRRIASKFGFLAGSACDVKTGRDRGNRSQHLLRRARIARLTIASGKAITPKPVIFEAKFIRVAAP